MDEALLTLAALLGATLRVAVPLVLCALAGVCSERAGVIDIGLEGKMLAAAFTAACLGALGWPAPLALLGACGVAVALSMVHGFACITHRGDQIVSGVALNLIAAGLTAVLGLVWFGQGGRTPDVAAEHRYTALFPEAAQAVRGWSGVGPLLAEGVLQHDALVWIAFAAVPLLGWLLYRTRFGLRLRAAGENPATLEAAGVSVAWLRYRATLLAGVLCGVAGAYLTLAQNAAFSPNMTAGRGFMALAAMVFGQWRPGRAAAACLLFGFLDALAIRLQGASVGLLSAVPVQLLQALPYLLTVVLLAGFFGRAEAPAALGRPYSKER
ncbi:ABC transporter permease [Caldimonas brevitalea]|uniref:Sugar ABC transporter permease n=1 Tax=Caldimonas brevitalea TaxID=413882 RepID=A0A0G3BIH5_9BURK|nr:ABC transporter permease [Caldimonas brevitalea]AKJ29177.1 sugar ABC transporter permease [Caldimonas brevitalea]